VRAPSLKAGLLLLLAFLLYRQPSLRGFSLLPNPPTPFTCLMLADASVPNFSFLLCDHLLFCSIYTHFLENKRDPEQQRLFREEVLVDPLSVGPLLSFLTRSRQPGAVTQDSSCDSLPLPMLPSPQKQLFFLGHGFEMDFWAFME